MPKPSKAIVKDQPASIASAPLAQTADLFQLLVDNIRDYAIILLDPKGTVLAWNKGAERLKGWKATEIIGQSFSRSSPPQDLAKGKTEMELKAALDEGRFEDEGWRVRQEGSRLWPAVLITPLPLLDITGVPAIDSQTAQHLIETSSAVRLLGAEVILTGVRPVIAQTLVHLGIDLSNVITRASLSAGLRMALEILKLKVTS